MFDMGAYQKKWYVANAAKTAWFDMRRNSRVRGMEFFVGEDEFCAWYEAQPKRCFYCDADSPSLLIGVLFGKKTRRFTIDRKDSSLPYSMGNVVLSCVFCNRTKSDAFTHEEFREIGQKFIKPKWQKKLELINAPA